MRRRSFLHAVGGGLGLGAAGLAGAHTAPDDTATPPDETPTGPGPLGSIDFQNGHEAVVSPDGTTSYVATGAGFAVVDISDPSAPRLLYQTDTVLGDHESGPMRGVWDLDLNDAGDRLLVVGPANPGYGTVRGAVYYDVSDPAEPRQVAAHETEYPIHNCFLRDGVGYLTGNNVSGNPLVLVEFGDDGARERARWSLFDYDERWREVPSNMRSLHDVWVRDDVAYLAHWDAGTWLLDVSDPDDVGVVSNVRVRPFEELVDVENPDRESMERPGNDHFVTVDESATLMGVGVEAWDQEGGADLGPGGIHLYDISDPAAPEFRSRLAPPPTPDPSRKGVWTTAHNFELVDDRCYASWYQGGVTVHDVTDPASPAELFHWRDADATKFWTAQRAVPGESFVASSWSTPGEEEAPGGLYVFPDPAGTGDTPTETAERETATGAPTTANDPDGGAGIGTGEGVLGLLGVGATALGVEAWRRR